MTCKEKELKKIGGYNAALCFYNSMWKKGWNDGRSKEEIIRNIVYHFSQHDMNAKPFMGKETYLKQFETAISNNYKTFGKRLADYLLLYEVELRTQWQPQTAKYLLNKIYTKVTKLTNIYLVEWKLHTRVPLEIKGKNRENMVAFLKHVKDKYEGSTAAGNSTNGANKLKF